MEEDLIKIKNKINTLSLSAKKDNPSEFITLLQKEKKDIELISKKYPEFNDDEGIKIINLLNTIKILDKDKKEKLKSIKEVLKQNHIIEYFRG